MGKEIFDQFDILGRNAHQVAGPSAHQIGWRKFVQLAEHVDPHLGKQSKRHVMGYPGLEPVQDTGERRDDRQTYKVSVECSVVLECEYGQSAENPHTDECHDPQYTEDKRQCESAFPGHDVAHQDPHDLSPVQPFCLYDSFGWRIRLGSYALFGCILATPVSPF